MTTTEQIQKAKKLGRQAFHIGKSHAPAQNKAVMEMIKGRKVGDPETIEICKAYTRAWMNENLNAPLN